MTNPDLAALSEAANAADEGLWTVADLVRQQLTKARWSFLMALEAAYRAGDLVHVPGGREGMRERVKTTLMTTALWHDMDGAGYLETFGLNEADITKLADAAIAAILGDVKP